MKTNLLFFSLIFLFIFSTNASLANETKLVRLAESMAQALAKLPNQDLGLDFRENLRNIPKLEQLESMFAQMQSFKRELAQLNKNEVPQEWLFLYEQLSFEIETRLMRLELEQDFVKQRSAIPTQAMHELKAAKAWYQFYLQYWTSDRMTPEMVYDYGLQEVHRVQQEIKKLQHHLGFSEQQTEAFWLHLQAPSFFIQDPRELELRYHRIAKQVQAGLSQMFFDTQIPEVAIRKDPNAGAMRPPGYYDDHVFYYNYFDAPYNWRAMEWLYMHEAVPGHHYQVTYLNQHPIPELAKVMNWYSGFQEGWAAYIENLGPQMGLYQDPYSYLGKWEWDLVRSARLVLDVGLNYLKWSKDDARTFWRQNIRGQDGIMEREIERVLRWPVQVITYKMGEKLIQELSAKEQQHRNFDIKQFHHQLLRHGPLPLPAIRSLF